MKHTTKCLITNSLVPLFLMSTSTNLTKKLNALYRVPIVFASMALGTHFANEKIKPKLSMLETEEHDKKVVH